MPRNTLGDLNNHLFAQLERLSEEDLAGEELMLFEQIESDIELDLNNICKRQCCKDCDNKCSYECGRVKYLDPVEQFKKEEIGQVSYKQLSFF